MKARYASALLVAAALTGCEQTNQALPFDADDVVTKQIAAGAAATVSTPAGASVQFPSNSMPTSTTVTLAQVPAPQAVQQSGAPVSQGFKLEPAGLALTTPAKAELKFNPAADRANAWLATVVNLAGGSARPIGNTRVDLNAGFVQAGISQLGTLAVVIPEAGAVFRLKGGTARASLSSAGGALAATGTDSVSVKCGEADNRCSALAVDASQNLRNMVEDAAALYPYIVGKLRFANGTATGELTLNTTIRVLLRSGSTAENVTFDAVLRPTASSVVTEDASRVRITNVRFSISGSASSGSGSFEEIATLDIPKGTSNGTTVISRSFQMRDANGQLKDAWVSVTFPLNFHQ